MKTVLALSVLALLATYAAAGAIQPAYRPPYRPAIRPIIQPAIRPAVRPPIQPARQQAIRPATRQGGYGQKLRRTVSTMKKLARLVDWLVEAVPQSSSSSADGACSLDSVTEFADGVKAIPGANLDPYPGLMTGEQVGKVCGVYDKAAPCMDKWPAGPEKILAEKSLGLPKYMCKDSSYKQHAQCIHEAVKSVKTTCEADNKCGKYNKVIDGAEPTSEETLKMYMKNVCLHMTCQRDCAKPKVEEKCTAAAGTAIDGIPIKGAELLKMLCDADEMPHVYPQECRAIAP